MKIGDKFNRLTALRPTSNKLKWLFQCECGRQKEMHARNVQREVSRSCGCLHKERTSAAKTTHGHSRGGKITPEFQAYRSMMARCYRRSNIRYEKYGGRGIAVCDEWRSSFETFLQHMGPRPSPKHSIDRRDNDGNYEPGNCRWATKREQGQNKSSNVLIVVDGRSMTMIEASEVYNIPYGTLRVRVVKRGWPHEKAVRQPVRPLTKRP